MQRVRVLVVDDSRFMTRNIVRLLTSHPSIEVVGTARDGREAVELVPKVRPDVITLDLEMPVMNGREALRFIMTHFPTPVVVVSTLTQAEADETIACLEEGAVDCVGKPSDGGSLDQQKWELVGKVLLAAASRPRVGRRLATAPLRSQIYLRRGAVALGASTGGPKNVLDVIPLLPADLPAPVFYVQHMPATFTRSYAERLDKVSALRVKEAEMGEEALPGVVYVAPGDRHLVVVVRPGTTRATLRLSQYPSDVLFRPSVDVLMKSVAEVYGHQSVGVLMTGMGRDGAVGMKAIHDRGGYTVAESKETCVVDGMPAAAVGLGAVDVVVPCTDIPLEILKWFTVAAARRTTGSGR